MLRFEEALVSELFNVRLSQYSLPVFDFYPRWNLRYKKHYETHKLALVRLLLNFKAGIHDCK